MSSLAESKKRTVGLLLFAWPAAVLIGWIVGQITRTDWPMAAFPVAWLASLFLVLRRDSDQPV